jgi:membrane-associated phospholipid phosphatase
VLRRRTWRQQAALLLGVWVLLVGVVVGVGHAITGPLRTSIDPPDNDLARWFADQRSTARSQLADVGTWLGDTLTVAVVTVALALGLWVWRRDARPVAFVAATMAGVTGLYLLAVTLEPRARPPVPVLDAGLVATHSFPSGHVGASTAVYGLVVVLVWTFARRGRWWVAPLLLVPPLVAVARLYEGAHHLSDVLMSMLYASAWLTATTIVLLRGEATARTGGRARRRAGLVG